MSGNPAYVTVSLCDCPRGNFMSPSTKQTLPYFILEDVCGRWGGLLHIRWFQVGPGNEERDSV